jgi:hypothetical protein
LQIEFESYLFSAKKQEIYLPFLIVRDDGMLLGSNPEGDNANWREISKDFNPNDAERRAKATACMTSVDMLMTDYR